MTAFVTIYVALRDEVVPVWRPVQAEALGGSRYRIMEQPYERALERWEFEPGEIIVCEPVKAEEGEIVAAVRRG